MYLETPAHSSVIPTTGAAEADFTGIQAEPGLSLRHCLLSENAVTYFSVCSGSDNVTICTHVLLCSNDRHLLTKEKPV